METKLFSWSSFRSYQISSMQISANMDIRTNIYGGCYGPKLPHLVSLSQVNAPLKIQWNNGCTIFHFDRTLYWIPTCLQIAHNIFTCLLDCAMERWEVVDTKVIASKVHRLDHCDTIRSRSELSRAQQSWQPSKMLFNTKYYLQPFIGIKQKNNYVSNTKWRHIHPKQKVSLCL